MTYWVLDADGQTPLAVDLHAWLAWMLTDPDRRIARTTIDGMEVSTMFLGGVVHGGDERPPRGLWETMVFGGPLDYLCVRYDSRADAVLGHDRLVARCTEVLSIAEQRAAHGPYSTLRDVDAGPYTIVTPLSLCATCEHPERNHAAGRCRKRRCGCGAFIPKRATP